MADFTPNYNLKKPFTTEYYNVYDFNQNMDIVDTQMKTDADDLAAHLADTMPHRFTDGATVGACCHRRGCQHGL